MSAPTPCTHKPIIDRNVIGAGWLIICTKCQKAWGSYNYKAEAAEAKEEMEGKA